MSAAANVCAVIVAGGAGKRFGNPGGKLLIDVAGAPLMSWTLRAFDAAECIGHIVVVCPEGQEEQMRDAAIAPYGIETPVTFAPSGAERQDSTRSGVEAVPEGFDYVAIHDAARPLITPAAIEAACVMLEGDPALDGVVCGQPAIDTLKLIDGDRIVNTPPRERYWCVQTPQVFRLASVARAHAEACAEGYLGTDDSSLVERAGGTVRCIKTARDNIKVTVPEDLALVTTILLGRLAGGEDTPHAL